MSDPYTKLKVVIFLIALVIVCLSAVLLLNPPTQPDKNSITNETVTAESEEQESPEHPSDTEDIDIEETQTLAAEEEVPIEKRGVKLVALENGIYHAAFPDFGPTEDDVTTERIKAFTDLIDKNIAWGYFSNNWFNGIHFPMSEVETLRENGVTPFIRLMPRSRFQDSDQDPIYTLEEILDGQFDASLREWARQARSVEIPLLVEFGTEMNGDWFTWAGSYNGADSTDTYGDPEQADGPERFRDAYRHIVDIFCAEGADNITWFFHVNITSAPDTDWNQPHQYYPGDDYVDWIGISVYGAQHEDDSWVSFQSMLNDYFDKIAAISAEKPIAILEFGVDERPDKSKADWISDALNAILSGEYPRIKAISYWHSTWTNNDDSISRLRLDSSEESLNSYRSLIHSPLFETTPNFISE